jgi:hypothetical protein
VTAVFAGGGHQRGSLRKGDMKRLTCADVNFTDSTITIRYGKLVPQGTVFE